jgi:hypothetical protein
MAMSIFDALKKDHTKVKGLFKQVTRKKQDASSIFPQIQQELGMLLSWEEQSFYPVLMQKPETHEMTMESMEEHNVAKKEMDEMTRMSPDDEWFGAKMRVLHGLVDHFFEEEETQLFRKAKKVIGKQQAEELGAQFDEAKHQLMGSSAHIKSSESQQKQPRKR